MAFLVVAVAAVFVLIVALPLFAYLFPPRSIRRSLWTFERRQGVPPLATLGAPASLESLKALF